MCAAVVRAMVPAIINQLVTLLKDSSLGALVVLPAVDDLLRRGRQVGECNRNPLQALLITGLVYVLNNFTLSSIARRIESRQSRRQQARAGRVWTNAQLRRAGRPRCCRPRPRRSPATNAGPHSAHVCLDYQLSAVRR